MDTALLSDPDFLSECARLLGTDHEWVKPAWRVTRWYPRDPGNGRFPGFGVIRVYSENVIHVQLYHPVSISRVFASKEGVLDYLRSLTSIS